jgi:outer membrane protein
MLNTRGFFAAVALTGALIAGPALAGDSNGNLQIKAGVTWANTDDSTKSVTANGVDISAGGANFFTTENMVLPTATITYYLNKNLAVELFCCAAGTSILGGGGLVGLGEVAHTYTFPPILTLQYHFDAMGPIRPYVGVGAEWIHFFPKLGSNGLGGNDVSISDTFGFALQGGVDFDLGKGWSLGIDVKKVWLQDTKVTIDTAATHYEVKHNLDPLFVTANLGYRFNLCDLLGNCGGGAPLK